MNCQWCGSLKEKPLGMCPTCSRFPNVNIMEKKTFKVQMLAFEKPEVVREVEVPVSLLKNSVDDLNVIYYYGQNDVQPKQCCSVSIGDVIEYNDEKYIVSWVGFTKLTEEDYDKYVKADQDDRRWNSKFRDLLRPTIRTDTN